MIHFIFIYFFEFRIELDYIVDADYKYTKIVNEYIVNNILNIELKHF